MGEGRWWSASVVEGLDVAVESLLMRVFCGQACLVRWEE